MSAAVGLFAVLVVIARLREPIWPLADSALLELGVIDAMNGQQLLGPYSRFGWRHPGPLLFYLLVPFYVAGGRGVTALSAGAVAINFAAIVVVVWIIWRHLRDDRALGFALLGFLSLYVARIHGILASPWNPHIVVLPLLALVISAAGMASGDVRLIPIAAALTAFLSQSHIGLMPVSIALTFIGMVMVLGTNHFREYRSQATRLFVEIAGWITVAFWLLPLIEELTRTPGNMTLIWRFFVANQSGQSIQNAIYTWSDMLAGTFRPDFYVPQGWQQDVQAHPWTLILAIVEIAALAAIATSAWRRERFHSIVALMSLVASIIGLWSTTRIVGDIADHEVFWISAIGLINAAVIVGWLGALLQTILPAVRLRGATVAHTLALPSVALVVGVAVLSVRELTPMRQRWLWVNPKERIVRALVNEIGPGLRRLAIRKPLVRVNLDGDLWGVAAGALLQLRKNGVPFAVSREIVSVFGQALSATGEEDWDVDFASPSLHAQLTGRPGNLLITEDHSVFVDALRRSR